MSRYETSRKVEVRIEVGSGAATVTRTVKDSELAFQLGQMVFEASDLILRTTLGKDWATTEQVDTQEERG